MSAPLRRRIERLERDGGISEAMFHVVGTDAQAREIATGCELAGTCTPFIIVTGVERPREQVSWDTTLASIAAAGRRITDPPLARSGLDARVYRP